MSLSSPFGWRRPVTRDGWFRFTRFPLVAATEYSVGYDIRASLLEAIDESDEQQLREVRLFSNTNRGYTLTAKRDPMFPEAYFVLPGGHRAMVPTGIFSCFPEQVEAQIRSRSGLSAKWGVVVLNAPGTIDPDYEGEWHVILQNTSEEPFAITDGMRIAQAVFAQTLPLYIDGVLQTEAAIRGAGGFGSTG